MRKPQARSTLDALVNWMLVIADDLDAVAHGSRVIEKASGSGAMPACDNAWRTASLSSTTRPKWRRHRESGDGLLKREELVTKVDESRILAPAAQLEIEQAPVEGQRLVDIANFEGDVIEPPGRAFLA